MLEKGKIRAGQLLWLLITVNTTVIITLAASPISAGSKQDSWLAEILSVIFQFIMLYIILKLGVRFPQMEFTHYIKQISGRFLGSLIVIAYIWFFLFVSSVILREITSFAVAVIYTDTPPVVISVLIILTSSYIVSHGIEVIARTNEIALPIIIVQYLIGVSLLFPIINLDNFKPMLENGLMPVLKGAFVSSSDFIFVAFIAAVLPYVNKPRECRRGLAIGLAAAGMVILVPIIAAIGVMGPAVAQTTLYKGYMALRYISYAKFIEHLDNFGLAIFTLGQVIKITVFYYASCLMAGQLLGLRSYRPLIVPAGIIILVLSRVLFKNAAQLARFFITFWPVHNYVFELAIPLFLLLLAILRKKGESEQNED